MLLCPRVAGALLHAQVASRHDVQHVVCSAYIQQPAAQSRTVTRSSMVFSLACLHMRIAVADWCYVRGSAVLPL